MMTVSQQHCFIFAGEPSGDLHGSKLLSELSSSLPNVRFSGVGGPRMRCHNLELLLPMEDFQVMGFTDVVRALPKLWGRFKFLCGHIVKAAPAAVILIDYPGFNLRLAKALRQKGYVGKIVHYISPTVWAWRRKRIDAMAKTLDLLLLIYPFEEEYYRSSSLKVTFVGNPLREQLLTYQYCPAWRSQLNIPEHRSLIALFPGSRPAEIIRNLPMQLQAAEMLAAQDQTCIFALSCSSSEAEKAILLGLQQSSLRLGTNAFLVPSLYTYELMREARCAAAKSGTVTLELALHHCPTVVMYKLSKLNYFIAKYCFRLSLPHYCIVNILAQKTVFPEFIEFDLTAANVGKMLIALNKESPERQSALAGCREVAELLEIPNANQRAAHAIAELLYPEQPKNSHLEHVRGTP